MAVPPGAPARRVLLVVTTLVLVAAAVAGYARAELVDRERFVARTVSTLDDEDVRTAVATRIVDRMARSVSPEVLVVRPLLLVALRGVADTAAFRRVVATAAADVHGQLLDGGQSYVVALGPSSPVLGDALRSVAPRVARALPDDLRLEVVEVAPGDAVLRGTRVLADLARWWWPLLIAALVAAAALAWVSRGVREAAALLGTAVLAAGLTIATAVTVVGLAIARADDPVRRGARTALWTAVAGDLRTTALLFALAGAGTIVAVTRAGVADPLQRAAGALRGFARSPRTALRVARALAVGLLGVGLIVMPALVASVAAVAVGALLVAVAASQLRPAPEAGAEAPRGPAPSSGRLLLGALAAPAVVAVVALVLVLPAPATVPAASVAPGSAAACNGSVALCGRRLNEVAFPGTHNSYSAADEPGWLFANQRRGIARQLQDGIRALLVDVHYGVADPESGRVRTDLRAEGSSRSKVARELSPEALRVADRLVDRVGAPLTGERRAYMCHTLCELGAEPLAEQFGLIRDFLVAEPRETIVMFVESYVAVAEIERAIEQSGLTGQAATLDRDEALPTLGELVAADTRLVVLAEEDGGAPPWFLPGFAFAQDTPLGARSARELRCDRFRGDADSPLLLLNHWIDTFPPSPTRNQRIGGRALRDRAARCARERALVPNLLAVDFYERSDVVAVAAQETVQRWVDEAHARFAANIDGRTSQVYPALADAPPAGFGICVVGTGGRVFEAGDAGRPFSIMSVSKPFVFALVCDLLGADAARERLGVDATGRPFNSLAAVEAGSDGRTNPMVNAGAIATTSLAPGASTEERWRFLRDGLCRFAGRELRLHEEVLASAAVSNARNQSIARLLESYGRVFCDPAEAVDLYTRQCALEATARDLAVMGATLADGGVNPVTGERVIDAAVCHHTLAVMLTAGLYETSGRWLYDVGLPAKSGIGGGIVTVSPGKGGLGTFAPLLDAEGNSVKGQLVAAFLSARLGLDLLSSAPERSSRSSREIGESGRS